MSLLGLIEKLDNSPLLGKALDKVLDSGQKIPEQNLQPVTVPTTAEHRDVVSDAPGAVVEPSIKQVSEPVRAFISPENYLPLALAAGAGLLFVVLFKK